MTWRADYVARLLGTLVVLGVLSWLAVRFVGDHGPDPSRFVHVEHGTPTVVTRPTTTTIADVSTAAPLPKLPGQVGP